MGTLKGHFQCLCGLHMNINSPEDHIKALQWITCANNGAAHAHLIEQFHPQDQALHRFEATIWLVYDIAS